MDVMEVRRATIRALTAVRGGGGPLFIEFKTYRFRAHSMFDPDLYRDPAEVERWKERDPVTTFSEQLRTEQIVSADEIEELWEAARSEIDDAVERADAAPIEPVATLHEHVLVPSGGNPRSPHVDSRGEQ